MKIISLISKCFEEWIKIKENELNSWKLIKNNISLEEIEIEIQKQTLFHSEIQSKQKEFLEFEININHFMEIKEKYEKNNEFIQ